jgi:exodeoxyribonuclease VII large subunit
VELAADGQAITPTAAAETVFPDITLLLGQLIESQRRLKVGGLNFLAKNLERLKALKTRLFRFENRLLLERQRLDNLMANLGQASRRYLAFSRQRLASLTRDLAFRSPVLKLRRARSELEVLVKSLPLALARRLADQRRELATLTARLGSISPLGVLSRGYALVTTTAGEVIRSSSKVPKGALIQVRLAQGQLIAQVTDSLPG